MSENRILSSFYVCILLLLLLLVQYLSSQNNNSKWKLKLFFLSNFIVKINPVNVKYKHSLPLAAATTTPSTRLCYIQNWICMDVYIRTSCLINQNVCT